MPVKSVAKILNAHPCRNFLYQRRHRKQQHCYYSRHTWSGLPAYITSPIEHHAVTHTVEHIDNLDAAKVGYKLLPNGHVDLDDLEKLLAASEEKHWLL